MGEVYRLTLRQLTGRWRLIIMTVLAALPVIITTLMVHSDTAPSVGGFERTVLSGMLAGAITPLIVLAIGTVAFANDIEDKTLANLTLSPIPRWQIVLPKLLAVITVAAPFIVISAFVTSYIAFLGDTRAVVAIVVSAIAAVALYAAAFVFLGMVTTQAIGVGLLYIVLWEGFFSQLVEGVRLMSVRHYSISLMHGIDARRFAVFDHMQVGIAAVTALVVFTGFVWLAVWRLRRMDVP